VSSALKLGTRGSELALWQAEWVKAALGRKGITAELEIIKTQGDADIDRPLHLLDGKGFFTKEIEQALMDCRIDVAVHSLKDLPTSLPDGLALGAVTILPACGNGTTMTEMCSTNALGVGNAADIPVDSAVNVPTGQAKGMSIFICHDAGGFYAVDAGCTHLRHHG